MLFAGQEAVWEAMFQKIMDPNQDDFHVTDPAQFFVVTAARITNNFIQDSYENEIKKFEFNI